MLDYWRMQLELDRPPANMAPVPETRTPSRARPEIVLAKAAVEHEAVIRNKRQWAAFVDGRLGSEPRRRIESDGRASIPKTPIGRGGKTGLDARQVTHPPARDRKAKLGVSEGVLYRPHGANRVSSGSARVVE